MHWDDQLEKHGEKRSVIRSAASMSLGTILSRILGLVRDIVLAAYFSKTVTDAFVVAFRLPNMFRRLLGEGSLSVSFLPIYIERKTPKANVSPEAALSEAKDLSNGIFTLLVLVTGVLSLAGIIWMDELMNLLVGGHGFKSVEGKLSITVWMARIMFAYMFLVTLYAFYMAIANSWQKFLIPALGPALFNLVFILFALIPDESLGRPPGEFLAWGVLFGGLIQMLLVAHLLWTMNLIPRLRWKPWKVPSVKRVLVNMLPGVAGLGVLQIISIINVSLASELPEGAHSYIYWGDRILELPQAIIAVSLGAALLPTLSQLHAEGKNEEMLQSATDHLQLLLFLTIPSALGLYLIAQPLAEAVFMRGQFSLEDAVTTSNVIKIYTVLLLASSFSRVLVPTFYARKMTWLPASISALTLFVHLGLALAMTKNFGLLGLVGATTLSGVFNVLALGICYRWLIGPLGSFPIFKSSLRWLPGLTVMGAWVALAQATLDHLFQGGGGLARGAQLFVLVVPGVYFYIAIAAQLKVKEAKQVRSIFKRKIKRIR